MYDEVVMPLLPKDWWLEENLEPVRSIRGIVLGPPGSGKRRHAPALANRYGVCHLTTGGMIQKSFQSDKTKLDKEVKAVSLDLGAKVHENLFIKLVEQNLEERECINGFIFDGFPRTVSQAEKLDEVLHKRGTPIDSVVEFSVTDEDWLIRRITGRLIEPESGRTYHTKYKPPKNEMKDDKTGKPLVYSSADDEKTVKKRISDYYTKMAPVLDFYKKKGLHSTVDAQKPTEYVSLSVSDIFDDQVLVE